MDDISASIIHREYYERRKREREEENHRLVQRRQELIAERQRLLAERNRDTPGSSFTCTPSRHSRSSLERNIEIAKERIPEFAERFEALKEEEENRKKLLQIPYKGELGPGSYEPWQLEDFYLVREFVKCWLDEVLDFIIYEPSGAAHQRIQTIVERFQEEIEVVEASQLLNEAVSSVCLNILEEVSEDLNRDIATACLTLHEQAKTVVDEMIIDAVTHQTGASQHSGTDDKMNLIFSAFQQLRKERERKIEVWTHTQKLQLQGISVEEQEQSQNAEDSFDGTVLHFHDIVPFDDIADTKLPPEFVDFREEESKYWAGQVPLATSLPLTKRYKGVSCTSVSPHHTLIALGTVLGDIAVWDLLLYPPRIIRSIKGNSTVIDISWSTNSSQLITLTELGTVQLWSLADTQTVTFNVNGFEPAEPKSTFKPSTLENLLTLEQRDLFFTKGPFVASRELIRRPAKAVFHPSMTFLGNQPSIVLGLENGNILKLNLEPDSAHAMLLCPRVLPNNGAESKIGHDIAAELFKGHEHQVIHISFVENISSMITVDSKGFINLWDYNKQCLTGFNWFSPVYKYRLDMSEVTYKPALGSEVKVEFTDKVKGQGRRLELNREEMIKKRKQVQTQINALFLGAPWSTEDKGGDVVTNLYAPKTVPETGAMFHEISHHKNTGLLSRYTTRLYRPVSVPCSRFVSCMANPSGTKLVFMLLFPENSPKEAHAVFVTVKLPSMTVSKNLIEAPMTAEGFKPDTCSFDISKPLNTTGTEYIIANLAGVLYGFSMATGNTVLAETEKGWIGCHMTSQQSHTLSTSRVLVVSSPQILQFLLFARRHNFASLVHISDHSTREQTLVTWGEFKHWQAMYGQDISCRQQMWSESFWTISGNADAHVECSVETIILDMIDQAIQIVDGRFTEDSAIAFACENKELPFVSRAERFQESDSVMSLQMSRMPTLSSLFSN